MFEPMALLLAHFSHFSEWPGLDDFQAFLDDWPKPIQTLAGKPLSIVEQAGKPASFEEHYAQIGRASCRERV